MKTNLLIFPLALALAATLATTGCKHRNPKVTNIPSSPNRNIPDRDPNTLPDANKYNSGEDPNFGGPGTRPTSNLREFEDMLMDPAALAAHTIHFSFDSAVVKKAEQSNIDAVAAALAANSSDKLLIEGNCDERGTEEYNRALGERRALAAREALSKAGVSADRIRTLSYGKDKPVDPGHDDAAWAKNRRADFILLHPKAGI
jgi:peptidoglycan-associated lipoprotein